MNPGGLVHNGGSPRRQAPDSGRSARALLFQQPLPTLGELAGPRRRILFPGFCQAPEILQALHLDRRPVQMLEAVQVIDGLQAGGQGVGGIYGKANLQNVADAFPEAFLPGLPGEELSKG